VHTRATLIKFSQYSGDSLWTHQYSQVGDTSALFLSTQLSDSSVISVGYKYFDSGTQYYSRTFILKTDKDGNYKWHKYLWQNTSSLTPVFTKILNLNDKDFIISGINLYPSPGQKGFVMKVDTNGILTYNLLKTHNTYTYSLVNDIIKLNDGTMLLCGGIMTNHDMSFTNVYWKPWLCRLNLSSGATINSRTFGTEKLNSHELQTIYEHTTGIIYSAGVEWLNAQVENQVTFYKFNGVLDSLYTRYYGSNQGGTYVCNSLIPTADNGFALAMQTYPITGQQQFWLKKTDSLGCDSALGCLVNSINDLKVSTDNFKIYPNPMVGVLKLENVNGSFENSLEIVVCSVLGEEIKFSPAIKNNEIEIDVSKLPKGIYFLKVLEKGNLVFVHKMVKE
jgi:hypothetical protein